MSVQKKSLISQRSAVKSAILATPQTSSMSRLQCRRRSPSGSAGKMPRSVCQGERRTSAPKVAQGQPASATESAAKVAREGGTDRSVPQGNLRLS